MSGDQRKDLPPANSALFLERAREVLSTYLGKRGDEADKGVTLRDLQDAGAVMGRDSRGRLTVSKVGGTGGGVPGPKGDKGDPGDNSIYTPDLTPPPTPSGTSVIAGITMLNFQTAAATYTQGHGHSRTRVYGATWTTGPKPTFSSAVRITEFTGNIFAYPTTPATTWHIWFTWVTNDGVESAIAAPSGLVNGQEVTTGQDVSLLLTALTGQIRRSQLYSDIGDPIDLINAPATTPGSVSARVKTATDQTATLDGNVRALYTVRAEVSAGGRTVFGGFGLAGTATAAEGPRIAFGVRADEFFVDAPAGVGQPISKLIPFLVRTTETTEGGVVIPPGLYGDAAFFVNFTAAYAKIKSLVADDITAAEINVDKLTAGTLKVGSYIQSSDYTPGANGAGYRISRDGVVLPATAIRGQLSAENMNGYGLTIRSKVTGAIIIDARDGLADSVVNLPPTVNNAPAGWLNSNLLPAINQAAGENLWTGNLATPTGNLGGGSIADAEYGDSRGTNTAVVVGLPVAPSYVYYQVINPGKGAPGWYVVTLKLKLAAGMSIVVATTDASSWDNSQYTIATSAITAGNTWVSVTLRQYVGTGDTKGLDVAIGSSHNGAVISSSPATTAVAICDLFVRREGYAGDLDATKGATWGSNVAGQPADSALMNSYVAMGANMIPNSSCTVTSCWFTSPEYTETILPAIYANKLASAIWPDTYVLKGVINNVAWNQEGTLSGGEDRAAVDVYPLGGPWEARYSLPAVAGKFYMWSVYAHMHRCGVGVGIYFYNKEGQETGRVDPPPRQNVGAARCEYLSEYIRPFVKMQAPDGTDYVRVYVRKFNTNSQTDSWIWLAAPQLEVVGADATGPSEYTPGPATLIGQLGYIGAMDATKGAPAGTYVGSNLAQDMETLTGAQDKADAALVLAKAHAVTKANAAYDDAIDASLQKAGGTITGRISMTVADGIFAGTDTNNGVYFGSGGLVGKKAGGTTFAVGVDGSAVFGGDLQAVTGTFKTVSCGTASGFTEGAGVWMDGPSQRFRVGNDVEHLRWSPGAGLEIKLNQISLSATVPSGGSFPLSSTIVRSLGSTTITASGGVGPYTFAWALADAESDPVNRGFGMRIVASGATCTFYGGSNFNCAVLVSALCFVTDSRGLSATIGVGVSAFFGSGPA